MEFGALISAAQVLVVCVCSGSPLVCCLRSLLRAELSHTLQRNVQHPTRKPATNSGVAGTAAAGGCSGAATRGRAVAPHWDRQQPHDHPADPSRASAIPAVQLLSRVALSDARGAPAFGDHPNAP